MAGEKAPRLIVALPDLKVGKTKAAHHVLERTTFDTNGASKVAIIGRSGSGKTTLLHAICGLDDLAPQATVQIEGGERFGSTIGLVAQDRALFGWLDVEENIELATSQNETLLARVAPLMTRLGIANIAKRFPFDLSGGEQARVALARALVSAPAVLLLDEPFSGLDDGARWELFDYIASLQAEFRFLAILVSHDLEEVVAFADRLYVLHGKPGRLDQIDAPLSDRSIPLSRDAPEFPAAVSALRKALTFYAD